MYTYRFTVCLYGGCAQNDMVPQGNIAYTLSS